MRGKLIAMICALLLGGCALMDTGEIDYRRAEPVRSDFAARIALGQQDLCQGTAPSTAYIPKRKAPNRYRPTNPQNCIPLFPARLIRKNASIGDPIVKNDVYSIRVEHAFIADLIEDKASLRRMMNGRDAKRKVGEVVVLAHAFEFAPDAEAGNTADFRFANLSSLNGVKVVYFSPDVEAGQSLNFSNIVLQAGRKYEGRPIGIQIVVLELDRMSGQMQGLMKRLAELGQESGALPGGPVAGALLELGTSLMGSDNDDVMFDYRFVLDPSSGTNVVNSPPFEAGRYVLRRTHERREMQIWDDLVLDHNTGQLMHWSANARRERAYLPFERDTYFTINIVKHPPGSEFYYGPQTFGQLGEELEAAANERDAPLAAVTERATAALVTSRKAKWNGDLAAAWRGSGARYLAYAATYVDPGVTGDDTKCKANGNGAQRRAMLLFEANAAAADFQSLYAKALAAEVKPGEPILDTDDQRRILAGLASFFLPAPSGAELEEAHLTDPSAFKSKFVDSGAAALQSAARQAAERNWAPKTCKELIASLLADPVAPAQPSEPEEHEDEGATPSEDEPGPR
ncbi:MAG TPA: hypothetical protein VF574_13940 [Allosphingosinicella sp.]|jgi:hypothetical protein